MGPHTPLNDIWISNVMRLIYPLIKTIHMGNVPWGFSTVRCGTEHEGVYEFPTLISDNQNLAIMEFLSPRYFDWDGIQDLSTLTKKIIKKTLITKHFHQWVDPNMKEHSLLTGHNRQKDLTKLFKHFSTNSSTELTLEHFSHLNKKIPPRIINHNLKLYTNSLATDKRIRFFAPQASLHPNANVVNPYPCYLCNVMTVDCNDSSAHIYQHCLVTKNALAILRSLNHIDKYFYRSLLNNIKHSPLFHLQYMVDSKQVKFRISFIVCFNYAIWHTRRRARLGHIGTVLNMAKRAADFTINLKAFWSPS